MRYVLTKAVTGFSLTENKITNLPAQTTVELPPGSYSRGIAYVVRDGESVAVFLDDIKSSGRRADARSGELGQIGPSPKTT